MSANVTVTLELSLKPEAADQFCASLPEELEVTRKFPGFVDILIRRHADDPSRVVFVEEWVSRADYDAYIAFRTETGSMDGLAAIVTEPPRVNIWDTRVV